MEQQVNVSAVVEPSAVKEPSVVTEPSAVTEIPAASSEQAIAHFAAKLAYETDCADVHQAMAKKQMDFHLLDVRGAMSFERSHVPGAINMPKDKISHETLSALPERRCFVVYCAGPHCNGADKAALKIAQLGFPVKIMIGGMTGWADEKFRFEGIKA